MRIPVQKPNVVSITLHRHRLHRANLRTNRTWLLSRNSQSPQSNSATTASTPPSSSSPRTSTTTDPPIKTDIPEIKQSLPKKKKKKAAASKQPILLDKSAFSIPWDACTVRGWQDGSLVFKFDQLDPQPEEELSVSKNPSLANFAWSNTVRLGVKFPSQIQVTLRKLSDFATEMAYLSSSSSVSFVESQLPKAELKYNIFKTYQKAVRKQEKILTLNTQRGSSSGNGRRRRRRRAAPRDAAMNNKNLQEEHIDEEYGHFEDEYEDEEYSSSSSSEEVIVPLSLLEMNEYEVNDDDDDNDDDEDYTGDTTTTTSVPKHEEEEKEKEGEQSGATKQRPFLFSNLLPLSSIVAPLFRVIASFLSIALRPLHRLYFFITSLVMKTQPWPPTYPTTSHHISPALTTLFTSPQGINKTTLAAAGFDSQGRCLDPRAALQDVPAWRFVQLLGIAIRDPRLYRSALTHPTALDPGSRSLSYERLEYLGDAVLELCTRELLMRENKDADEGLLNSQGQFLVSGSTIAQYGQWLQLDKWILCNAYAMRDGACSSKSILEDSFEALLGAVYLDLGLESARAFLLRSMKECPAVQWEESGAQRDYIGMLLKYTHQRKILAPRYRAEVVHGGGASGGTNSSSNNKKKRYWKAAVEVGGEVVGEGWGDEKKAAEQSAAHMALIGLGELEE